MIRDSQKYKYVPIKPETKTELDELGKKNQTYDEILKILISCWKEKKNHTDMDDEEWTEGQLNKVINQMVKTYLNEKLPKDQPDNRLPYTETVNCISYLVQKETGGRGSPVTVRRAIDVKCSAVSEFDVIRESGKRYIIRRVGQ